MLVPVFECTDCGGDAIGSTVCALCRRAEAEAEEARFEALIASGGAHDCGDYRLPNGDCEVCWLASK
jgi:hypothetical protein